MTEHFPKANIASLLEAHGIKELVELLGQRGEVYLVGGGSRALLQPKAPARDKAKDTTKDIDLVSSLKIDEIQSILEKADLSCYRINRAWQTLLVGGLTSSVEVSEFKGGADNIVSDLELRDFTINSIAINLRSGEVSDPYMGRTHLQKKLLVGTSNPKARFEEDPLRLLRLSRFVAELGFEVEADTAQSAQSVAEKIHNVASERISRELQLVLCSEHPGEGLTSMARLGLLERLLPEVARLMAFYQNDYHHEDAFQHTLSVLSKVKPKLENRLAALLHDISKPECLGISEDGDRSFYKHETVGEKLTEKILERFNFSSKTIKSVACAVRNHMRPIDLGDAGLRRLLRDLGEDFDLWRDLKEADYLACAGESETLRQEFQEFDTRVREEIAKNNAPSIKNLDINGNDLSGLGFPKGPIMGDCLEYLLEEVIKDPEKNKQEVLLAEAKTYLERKSAV